MEAALTVTEVAATPEANLKITVPPEEHVMNPSTVATLLAVELEVVAVVVTLYAVMLLERKVLVAVGTVTTAPIEDRAGPFTEKFAPVRAVDTE